MFSNYSYQFLWGNVEKDIAYNLAIQASYIMRIQVYCNQSMFTTLSMVCILASMYLEQYIKDNRGGNFSQYLNCNRNLDICILFGAKEGMERITFWKIFDFLL